MPHATVFAARRVITMDEELPDATAVAVSDGRITVVGSVDDLRGAGDLDETFSDAVLVPGLIDQHLHPLLGATTLMTAVIAVEDWVLPHATFPAAASPEEYRERLAAADRALTDPAEWLFSWGYHKLWHGPLDRAALDEVSPTRPIVVWQRSCHEFFLNTAATTQVGLTDDQMTGHGPASEMVDISAGHWWESGTNLLLPALAPMLMSAQRLTAGLHQMVGYLHANGVTAINEPGIMWAIEPWELYQQILGADETPFTSTFLVDARSQADAGMDPAGAVADAERQVASASTGKVRLLPKQVKLFADGAIISQLMQMREPYLDSSGQPDLCHHGEWMMQPDTFRAFARAYWIADWQLHIHVNGDAALDLVLDTVEGARPITRAATTARSSFTSPIRPRSRSTGSRVWAASSRRTRTTRSASPISTAGTAWDPGVPMSWCVRRRCCAGQSRCRCTPICRWARPRRWRWRPVRSTVAPPAAAWSARSSASRCTMRYGRSPSRLLSPGGARTSWAVSPPARARPSRCWPRIPTRWHPNGWARLQSWAPFMRGAGSPRRRRPTADSDPACPGERRPATGSASCAPTGR